MARSHHRPSMPTAHVTNHRWRRAGVMLTLLAATLGLWASVRAEQLGADAVENAAVSYHEQIRPILQARCHGCHQPAKAKGGYVMTAFDKLLSGGETDDPAIVPGDPERSALLDMILPLNGKAEMPKGEAPLTAPEIELIRRWIAQGARDDTPANAVTRYDADHPPVYSRQPVVTSMDYAPNGALLAVAAFHEVLLLKPDGSEIVGRLVGLSQRITSVCFSPDGTRLAVTGGLPASMGEVQVWDVAERKLITSAPVGYDTVYGASWSPDSAFVAFGCPDNTVRAIDAATGEQVFFNGAHNDWALDTVFSVDGKQLVSVGRDMSTKLHEFAEQRFIDNVTSITPGALKGGILAVARHPQRDEIVIGGSDGAPKVYRIHRQTKRVIGDDANVIRVLPEMRGRVNGVAVSADGVLIAAGSSLDGTGQVFVYPYGFDGALPDDVKKIMAKRVQDRNADEKARIEKYKTDGVSTVARIDVPDAAIYAVAFAPDGKTLAAAGSDGLVRLIDPTGGVVRATFAPAPIDDDATKQVDAGSAPDFIVDVNPVLSRVGCNAGTCHGSLNGKNGFKLSLRGYDALYDVRALTDDHAARRINLASPDDSLMLMKATGAVPHEGGQLFKPGDPYYRIVRDWIASGAELRLDSPRVAKIEVTPINPTVTAAGDRQPMKVIATYTDGATRDVTREAFVESSNTEVATTDREGVATALRRGEAPLLARYEGAYAATTLTVMGDRDGFVWEQPAAWGTIDELVARKWERMKIRPAELCTDAEFIRRVYLDLTGLPPTSEETRVFLADERETRIKRDELVDRLIGSDAYVEHWTNKWADLLQVNGKFLGREGAGAFRDWIRGHVAANTPYDEFARQIIAASGSNKDNPAVSYYKVLREPTELVENTTHLFLAIRFNCNKCHDHPFERWTQDQYYETAAYFARVDLKRDPASGDRKIGGTAVEGAKPLYEIVDDKAEGEITHDRTRQVTPPSFPYEAEHETAADATRRQELAAWITSPDNRYFARSYANRLWGYLFGVGIIEPIDDIRASNPPSNPALLDHLTKRLVDSGFDSRAVIAEICKSRTYQLSFRTNRWNEDDSINYSHAQPRRLAAEVLYDAVHTATGSAARIPGVKPGTRAAALPDAGISLPDGFLETFGRPARESSCECERSNELQLGPVMALVSGPTVADAIADPNNAITRLAKEEADNRKLIDALFLRILSRPASDAEAAAALSEIDAIEADHRRIAAALAEMEAEHAPALAKLASEREARITAAKQRITEYEAALPAAVEAWAVKQGATTWTVLTPSSITAVKGTQLAVEDGGSIFASGPNQKDVYEFVASLETERVTGIRLELLADDRLPSKGPGRASNGNFVLSDFELHVAGPETPDQFSPAKLANAMADYSQKGYEVATAIDGQAPGAGNGWATHPETGKDRTATFEVAEPGAIPTGSTLKLRLIQEYQGNDHQIGRFRIAVTSDSPPFTSAPPEAIAPILAVAPAERNEEQVTKLRDYYREQDAKHKELQAQLAEAQRPVPIPPDLAALSSDAKYARDQLANDRLTLAQDLAWALINSPAFLYNH